MIEEERRVEGSSRDETRTGREVDASGGQHGGLKKDEGDGSLRASKRKTDCQLIMNALLQERLDLNPTRDVTRMVRWEEVYELSAGALQEEIEKSRSRLASTIAQYHTSQFPSQLQNAISATQRMSEAIWSKVTARWASALKSAQQAAQEKFSPLSSCWDSARLLNRMRQLCWSLYFRHEGGVGRSEISTMNVKEEPEQEGLNTKGEGEEDQQLADPIEELLAECGGAVISHVEVSLLCPISQARIKVPVKGKDCRHLNCFDKESWTKSMKDREKKKCPICQVEIEEVVEDEEFQKILQQVPDGISSFDMSTRSEFSQTSQKNQESAHDVIVIDDD
uniref:SP-RING-type domain-containing protein n=1 Tax=Guillardia theta TaxID=55529 RepID=A0A7S4UCT4_GUITH